MWLLGIKLGKVNGGLISNLAFTFFLIEGFVSSKAWEENSTCGAFEFTLVEAWSCKINMSVI